MGTFIISGTALASFAGFVLVLWTPVSKGRAHKAWFMAWLLLVVHTIAAFHFVHHWSHQHAMFETARQTKELTGINWAGGVYLNYVLIAVWGLDCPIQRSTSRPASRWKTNAHLAAIWFLAFMWFNATVVFGGTSARFVGIIAFGALIWRWFTRSSANPVNQA